LYWQADALPASPASLKGCVATQGPQLKLLVQTNLSKAISKQSLKGTVLSFKTEESKGHISILPFFHALLNYLLFCQTAKKNLPVTALKQDWYNWLCGNSSIS